MFWAEVETLFMSFILHISGFHGQTNSICAPKGSSVDLPCLTEHQTSNMRWFTINSAGLEHHQLESSADDDHVVFNMSKENKLILTIKDVRESDENNYCCTDVQQWHLCWPNRVQLSVADLQVKVIPTTEGHTVSLMCDTNCTLPGNIAAYVWYKNGEFLYEDWSPWYQRMVSSNKSVKYSCAIKGYEDLRAPEVSVDSVTSTCFYVTYAKGRMCSYVKKTVNETCSITYPREVHVEKTNRDKDVQLTCVSSCLLTEPTFYSWYNGGYLEKPFIWTQGLYVSPRVDTGFTCAVKGHEDLVSAEFCLEDANCWKVDYVSRRICALEGSTVSIVSKYLHPGLQQPSYKWWYRIENSRVEAAEKLTEEEGGVEFQNIMDDQHILKIKDLKKKDSAEYRFRLQKDDTKWRRSNLPGVILIVTDLRVEFTPSAVVTEGQRVTLTCSTSCPLTGDYIWYLNRPPLTLLGNQNKDLVLDHASTQHAGNYSCGVAAQRDMRSPEKTLTVGRTSRDETGTWIPAAAAGVSAALLVVILVAVILLIRKKKSSQHPGSETSQNIEQLSPGPVYEEVSVQPTEPDDPYYSRVRFSEKNTDFLYSTVQAHPPREQEDVQYSAVTFKQQRDS